MCTNTGVHAHTVQATVFACIDQTRNKHSENPGPEQEANFNYVENNYAAIIPLSTTFYSSDALFQQGKSLFKPFCLFH